MSGTTSTRSRTFIEQARREQIVTCAVEVIAEHGFHNTSLAKIAERAGISKGVISYHFKGKDDLLFQVLEDYGTAEQAYVFSRVDAARTSVEALEAYIAASIEFVRQRPSHLRAVIEIVLQMRDSSGKMKFDVTSQEWAEEEIAPVERLLRRGQDAGEFRAFDPRIMAVTIRGAIEHVAMQRLTYPDLDLDRFRDEMTTIFRLATQRG